jgi:hypothetical protein
MQEPRGTASYYMLVCNLEDVFENVQKRDFA